IDRWRRTPPLVVDVLLAGVVAIVTVIAVVVKDQQDSSLSMTTWGWVFLTLQFVPLGWGGRAPVLVLLICWTGAGLFGTQPLPDPPLMFAPLLATYTVAAYRPRRISLPIMGLLVVGSVFAIWGADGSDAADVAVGYFAG